MTAYILPFLIEGFHFPIIYLNKLCSLSFRIGKRPPRLIQCFRPVIRFLMAVAYACANRTDAIRQLILHHSSHRSYAFRRIPLSGNDNKTVIYIAHKEFRRKL